MKRIAASLSARATHALHASARQTNTSDATVGQLASPSLPWQVPSAKAAAAVEQANAAGFGATPSTRLASQPLAALAMPSANPFLAATATPPTPPRGPVSAPEQEWVQAVQRVIFTRQVLDKVADDVVAKIEKRVRIERERRGI
jgi:hypothetical protein